MQISHHKVQCKQDKQSLLILNSYIMSSLPPQDTNAVSSLTNLNAKPVNNMMDVRRKVKEFQDQQLIMESAKPGSSISLQ